MLSIRQVDSEDLGEIIDIEMANFSDQEAASPQVLAQRMKYLPDTFLVAEQSGRLAAYIVGPVGQERYLDDQIFTQVTSNPKTGGYIQVQSLSVAPSYQGQGLGTALLAAMKDLAVAKGRLGITLTCHADLIAYYEANGFSDEGESDSTHGDREWFNMVWDNPHLKA